MSIKIRNYFLCAVVLLAASISNAHAADPEAEVEKLIGKPIAESFKLQYGVITDPTVNAWVNRIGQDVAAQSPRQDVKYTFVIGDTDIINAFSLPGGTIFVTRGLLDNVRGDEELAGVLAHEVGHAYHYHAAKLLIGGVALSVFNSEVVKPNTDLSSSAMLLADSLALLSFSRHNESEADESGVDFSSKAGYDPRGLVEFFDQINDAGKGRPNRIAELFDTHPEPPDRIRRVDERIGRLVTDADWKRIGDRLNERRMYGRAAEVYDRAHDAVDCDAAAAQAAALPAPAAYATDAPEYLPDRHAKFSETLNHTRIGLKSAIKFDRINSALQQFLALSVSNRDVGMILLAAQAYSNEVRAQSIVAEVATVTNTAPGLWNRLGGPGAEPVGSSDGLAASIAAADLSSSASSVAQAVGPLKTAQVALMGAILYLNAQSFGAGFASARTAHYAALEAALLLASSDMDRASNAANEARRLLDSARLRLLEAHLNRYPVSSAYTAIAADRLNLPVDTLSGALTSTGAGYGTTAVLLGIRGEIPKNPPDAVSIMKQGSTSVDAATSSGASLASLVLTESMLDHDFESARTVAHTGAIP